MRADTGAFPAGGMRASPSERLAGIVDVYYTVDVELWCDGWSDIDAKFSQAYLRYIMGQTASGTFGLPHQIRILQDHGLSGSFFVEPLFSARFGRQALADIVGMLVAGGQDVQLHLHTEWADEAKPPLLGLTSKRQFLRDFDLDEQISLLNKGRQLLLEAGAPGPTAFRAGSFGFNADTLRALPEAGLFIDASYNLTMFGPASGVSAEGLTDTCMIGSVCEVPMTVFTDGFGKLRHAQLAACSWPELESMLWCAHRQGQRAVVILAHSVELLDQSRRHADGFVRQRFENLCRFLDRHRDHFRLRTFVEGVPRTGDVQPPPLSVSKAATARRIAEQVLGKGYLWIRG